MLFYRHKKRIVLKPPALLLNKGKIGNVLLEREKRLVEKLFFLCDYLFIIYCGRVLAVFSALYVIGCKKSQFYKLPQVYKQWVSCECRR